MANEEKVTQEDYVPPQQEVLVGFIASDVSMGVDEKGQDVFKARFKSRGPSIRTETGWERGETVYGNLRVYGPKAEMANQKFRDMDAFIASGREESYPRDDGGRELFFYADDIGHNAALMVYTVDRTKQIEQKKIWDQQREARRTEHSPSDELNREEARGGGGLPSEMEASRPSAMGSREATPAPFPAGAVAGMVAREALMQNEQIYSSGPQPSHDPIAR